MATSRQQLERWFAVVVVLFAIKSAHGHSATLYEGSECVWSDRVPGTCRFLTQCPSQLSLVSSSRRFRPQICSFQGSSPIVCCPHEHGPTTAKRPFSEPTKPDSTPTTQTTIDPTPHPTPSPATQPPFSTEGSTMAGQKSAAVCRANAKQSFKYLYHYISNGKQTKIGDYPHMALLGYRPPPQTYISWHCGGSLISNRFVVSAAHCFANNMMRAPVVVRLGEWDLADDEDSAVNYGIKNWVRHPNYTKPSWYHDLALIELNRLVQFSAFVRPACVWNQPQDPDTGLIVTGWGSTQEDGPMSEILLEGNGTLNRVSTDICTEFYKAATLELRNGIQDGILCAMDPVGTVDTCSGDSGGPIQVKSNLTGIDYYVVGVVSGGSKWCGNRVPAIYTSLHNYIGWIESVVWP